MMLYTRHCTAHPYGHFQGSNLTETLHSLFKTGHKRVVHISLLTTGQLLGYCPRRSSRSQLGCNIVAVSGLTLKARRLFGGQSAPDSTSKDDDPLLSGITSSTEKYDFVSISKQHKHIRSTQHPHTTVEK